MDKDEIWNAALALMLENVEEDDPKSAFLKSLTPFVIFDNNFVFQAASTPVETWVRKNYLTEIQEKLQIVSGVFYKVELGPAPTQKEQPAQNQKMPIVEMPNAFIPNTPEQAPAVTTLSWDETFIDPRSLSSTSSVNTEAPKTITSHQERNDEMLFSKCSFDTFVVGKSNEFARGAALAVAEQPGTAYNPLFIYGNSGLGKTHLLVAIANYAMQNFPWMTTRYVSANTFLSDYVEATQRNQWGSFNSKYHQVDILLIDDVQYLEGKDETINQLFNIFNEMTNKNKQIVLSADRAPKDIDMDDRMRSRFISGLLADIKPPDYETRLAILKNYLSRVNRQTSFYGNIPDDVLSFLADTATSNIREMEGAVNRLVSNMALLKKNNISIEEAQDLLQDFFPSTADKQVDIARIQSEVERFFNVSHEDIISAKRSKGIAMPRHIAIYLSRYLTDESLQEIGKKFGGRDHTTVMHSVSKIDRERMENRILYDQLEQLSLRIKEHR